MLPNPSAQNHDKYSNQWVRWSFFDCICQIILKPLFLITKHTSFPLDHPVNRNNPLLRISRWQYNMSFLRLHDSNKLWRDFGGIHLFFITFRVYVTWLNPVSERIAIKRNPCTSFPGERRWISLHSSTNLSRTAGLRASETSPPIPAQVLNKFKQPPPTHTHTPSWTTVWRNPQLPVVSVSPHLRCCSTSIALNWSRQREEGSLRRQRTGARPSLARSNREQKVTMAENKIGPNLQAGAGFIAKRVQKSLNRAQEKVSEGKHSHWLSLPPEPHSLVSVLGSVLKPLEWDTSLFI